LGVAKGFQSTQWGLFGTRGKTEEFPWGEIPLNKKRTKGKLHGVTGESVF